MIVCRRVCQTISPGKRDAISKALPRRPRTQVNNGKNIQCIHNIRRQPRVRPVHCKSHQKSSSSIPSIRANSAERSNSTRQRQLLPAGRYYYPCICTPVTRLLYYSGALLTAVHYYSVPTYVAEFVLLPVRRWTLLSLLSLLMRLPTSTRLSFTCSGGALCNNSTTPYSSLRSATVSSSYIRRKAVGGQSRVLLTAAADPRQRRQQQSQAATPLRSPLQWSGIVHRIRKPTGTPISTTMGGSQQVRAHSHGHGGHHHHHDNTFLTSANKSDPGVRITRVGLYVNLGMAVAKGAGGYIFNSQA